MMLWGVNLTGGEGYVNGDKLAQSPEANAAGYYDYIYPTFPELDYYASKGATVLRLAFLARRIMDPVNGTRDIDQIARLIARAASYDMDVVLGSWGMSSTGDTACITQGVSRGIPIGTTPQSNADFAAEWTAIAKAFGHWPNVMYSLTNEPNVPTLAQWLVAANGAIAAIRATGDTHTILVPGVNWTNAHYWLDHNDGLQAVVDPAKNFCIEVHGYLDAAGQGVIPAITGSGATLLVDVTTWARAHGLKLFLGEYGFGRPADAPGDPIEGAAEQQYLLANSDVWLGACAWVGGPIWDASYPFVIRPAGLPDYWTAPPTIGNSDAVFNPAMTVDAPQMSTLLQVWGK